MEKEDFYALVALTGIMTFFLSSFFFIGNQGTYQKLVEHLILSFFARWIGFTIIGFLLFLGLGFVVWLFARLVEKDFKGKKRILLLGLITQTVCSFLGCLNFFKLF